MWPEHCQDLVSKSKLHQKSKWLAGLLNHVFKQANSFSLSSLITQDRMCRIISKHHLVGWAAVRCVYHMWDTQKKHHYYQIISLSLGRSSAKCQSLCNMNKYVTSLVTVTLQKPANNWSICVTGHQETYYSVCTSVENVLISLGMMGRLMITQVFAAERSSTPSIHRSFSVRLGDISKFRLYQSIPIYVSQYRWNNNFCQA